MEWLKIILLIKSPFLIIGLVDAWARYTYYRNEGRTEEMSTSGRFTLEWSRPLSNLYHWWRKKEGYFGIGGMNVTMYTFGLLNGLILYIIIPNAIWFHVLYYTGKVLLITAGSTLYTYTYYRIAWGDKKPGMYTALPWLRIGHLRWIGATLFILTIIFM